MLRLATLNQYDEAQEMVDRLSDAGFPVERTAIVAEGLRLYEQVTGRTSWLRAAAAGALQGLIVGLFLAWLFTFLSLAAPAIGVADILLWGAAIGLLFGAAFGLIAYAVTAGRRDFTSVSGIQAASYTVLVESDFSEEARRILGLPAAGASLASRTPAM
jgi:hypothetical protein